MYRAELRLAVVGYAPAEPTRRGPVTPLDLRYTAQDRDRVLRQGIEFALSVPSPEDVNTLRLIVFDRGSNAVGSVTMPLPENMPGKPN